MARWIVPAAGILVIVVAAGVALVAWSGSGGSSSVACDQDALVTAMRDAITSADRDGAEQVTPDRPDGCSPDDMTQAMLEVSRSWHVMPDGRMMRAPEHTP